MNCTLHSVTSTFVYSSYEERAFFGICIDFVSLFFVVKKKDLKRREKSGRTGRDGEREKKAQDCSLLLLYSIAVLFSAAYISSMI